MLRGLDSDTAGLEVVVDAEPLPEPVALHEVIARLEGRGTYNRTMGGGKAQRWEITHRSLPYGEAALYRFPVLRSHRC